MQQLTPHVYGILKWFKLMNCYLVVNGTTITAVDFGTGTLFTDAIEAGIQSLGMTLANLQYAFVTHCHNDHVGGLAELQKRAPHMQTYAHRLDAPVMRGDELGVLGNPTELSWWERRMIARMPTKKWRSGRVDVEVEDGTKLDFILAGAQAVHLPGHSLGQTGLWLSQERTLIGGDVMANMRRLSTPFRAVSPSWDDVKASIRKVSQMEVANLCLGHGAPLIGNASAKVQELVGRL